MCNFLEQRWQRKILREFEDNFQTIYNIKANSAQTLKAILNKAIQDYFAKWKHRWEKCVNKRGGYFDWNKD